MLDVGVLVCRVGRRGLLEVEGAPLSVVRQVQGCETSAEDIRAVIKPGDSATQVEMMDCVRHGEHLAVNADGIAGKTSTLGTDWGVGGGAYGCRRRGSRCAGASAAAGDAP